MKKSKSLLFCSLALSSAVLPLNAFCQEADAPHWEITGATSGSFLHVFGNDGNSDSNDIQLGVGAAYFVLPTLEISFQGSFNDNLTANYSAHSIQAGIGPVFNFLGDVPQHSFFLEGHIGLLADGFADGSDYTVLSYSVALGHRFELMTPHVTWSPKIAVTGHTGSTHDADHALASQQTLDIIPLEFSILF